MNIKTKTAAMIAMLLLSGCNNAQESSRNIEPLFDVLQLKKTAQETETQAKDNAKLLTVLEDTVAKLAARVSAIEEGQVVKNPVDEFNEEAKATIEAFELEQQAIRDEQDAATFRYIAWWGGGVLAFSLVTGGLAYRHAVHMKLKVQIFKHFSKAQTNVPPSSRPPIDINPNGEIL